MLRAWAVVCAAACWQLVNVLGGGCAFGCVWWYVGGGKAGAEVARWGGWEGKGGRSAFAACAVREVLLFMFSIADFSVRGNMLVFADFGIRGNMVIVADLGVRAEIIIRNDVVAYVHLPAVMGFPLFGPPERLVRE